jgi:SAM-dependent methyltransferase
MLPSELPDSVVETATAFGWQWHAFPDQDPEFHSQFLEWLHPVGPKDFLGRRILDAGCGTGRHLLLAHEFGANHLVGLDLSTAVDVAQRLCAHLPQVDIVQGNLLDPPFVTSGFDLIYSIGVIHHVPSPEVAVKALSACLNSGGTLHVWVYGYEGNALVRRFMEPVRQYLAQHGRRSLVRTLTLPLAVLLSALARVASARCCPRRLPYGDYLRQIRRLPVRQIWSIIYDQLMAPTTHYVKREQLEAWFSAAGLTDVVVRDSRGMSWSATGRRP